MTAVDRDGGARISHVENKGEFVACGEVGESSVSRTDDRGRGRDGFALMIQGGEKNDFIGRLGLETKKSVSEYFSVLVITICSLVAIRTRLNFESWICWNCQSARVFRETR